MKRTLIVIAAVFLLSGCEPSFKEEYEATLKELEATKQALAVAQTKLKAADNEMRHKIFTLIRRTNNHLQTSNLDLPLLSQTGQELKVHIDSYNQLTGQSDHVSVTAEFYYRKLDTIRELLKNSRSTYDRRYNECLTTLGNKGNKNELSSMLCEVQADVAKQKLSDELNASIKALLFVAENQVQAGRQGSSANRSPADLEQEFKAKVENVKLQQSRG